MKSNASILLIILVIMSTIAYIPVTSALPNTSEQQYKFDSQLYKLPDLTRDKDIWADLQKYGISKILIKDTAKLSKLDLAFFDKNKLKESLDFYGGKLVVLVKLRDKYPGVKELTELKHYLAIFSNVIEFGKFHETISTQVIKIKSKEAFTPVLKKLSELDVVEFIELSKIYHLCNIDSHVVTGALPVWVSLGYTGAGVKIAVLDTGIDPSHPDFAGKIVAWNDFINGQPTPYDDQGHGTHVAGSIAGLGAINYAHSGEYVWHSMPIEFGPNFGYMYDHTYLVYRVTLPPGIDNVTISFYAFWKLQNEYIADINTTVTDWVRLYVSTNGSTWTLLDSYTGNQSTYVKLSYTVNVAGATTLYVNFSFEPTWSWYWWDNYDVAPGFFLDDFNVSDSSGTIFYDDAETQPTNVEVLGWVRAKATFSGMAPDAQLMIGKVCSPEGCPETAILDGIEWAVLGPDNTPNTGDEADIISMSLGGSVYSYDSIMQQVDWAHDQGIVVIVAAGNSGYSDGHTNYYTIESPGAAKGAIAVGATGKNMHPALWSSRGPVPDIDDPWSYAVKPDIAAPGLAIISARAGVVTYDPTMPYSMWFDEYYWEISGTSMATPTVAGLVALIKQAHPDWDPEIIRSALVAYGQYPLYVVRDVDGTDIKPPLVWDMGGGFVNVYAALTSDVVPVPAIISFNEIKVDGATDNVTTVTITFHNFGANNVTIELVNYHIYDLDGNTVSDHTVTLSSTSFTVPAGSATNIDLTLTVPGIAPTNDYSGEIIFQVYEGNVSTYRFHIVFGYHVTSPLVKIYGYVVDAIWAYKGYFVPIENAYIQIYNLTGDLVGETYSSLVGYYEIILNRDDVGSAINITVSGVAEYYIYQTPYFSTPESDTELWIGMTHKWEYSLEHILVVIDDDNGYGDVYDSDIFVLNGTGRFALRPWYKSVQGIPPLEALLAFPAVWWHTGGIYYGAIDSWDIPTLYDYYAARGCKGGIILEGGDIGYDHEGEDFLADIAHASFVDDMWPDNYTVNVALSGHFIVNGLPESFIVDADTWYNWPDAISPVSGAKSLLEWPFGESATVIYDGFGDGEPRTVYYAFALEGAEYFPQLFWNTIDWVIEEPPQILSVSFSEHIVGIETKITAQLLNKSDITSVTIEISNGTDTWILELFDDGSHGDENAHDGVYTTTFVFESDGKYTWTLTAVDVCGNSSMLGGTIEVLLGNVIAEGKLWIRVHGKWLKGTGTVAVIDLPGNKKIRVEGDIPGYRTVSAEIPIRRKIVSGGYAIYVAYSPKWGRFILRVNTATMRGFGYGTKLKYSGKVIFYNP